MECARLKDGEEVPVFEDTFVVVGSSPLSTPFFPAYC